MVGQNRDGTPDRKSATIAIDQLADSIKKLKFDPDSVMNIACFYNEKLLIWNDDDQRLYACSLDDDYNVTEIQIATLSSLPAFSVNFVGISPCANYLALYGHGGLMVAELPHDWSLSSVSQSAAAAASPKRNPLLIRSYAIAERMFLCSNRQFRLLCVKWHPSSKRHLITLTNDNYLRLFDIEDEYEPVKAVFLGRQKSNDPFRRSFPSRFAESLGENTIAFDFSRPLSHYCQENNSMASDQSGMIDIYPIYTLKENGDVSLIYLSLKDLSSFDRTYGPLRMTPAAEDNYGSDACTILCLDCVPPMIVIGTKAGLLYHCLAIESDSNENEDQNELWSISVGPLGTTVMIPEIVLYVLETITLSFPLATYREDQENHSGHEFNELDINTPLFLVPDLKDFKRYYCLHSFGVHIVSVSFLKQLINTKHDGLFHDDESIVEYFICTQPTVGNSNSDSIRPIGIALMMNRGYTYLTVLLNSGELVSKRLSNVLLEFPETDPLFIDADESKDLSFMAKKKQYDPQSTDEKIIVAAKIEADKKPNFSEHINKILTRSSTLPLIKSSQPRNAPIGATELEMLLNSIEILKKEYLEKYMLAAKAIEKRKTALKNLLECQLQEIEQLEREKDQILKAYVDLVQKYDNIQEKTNHISQKLEQQIDIVKNQWPSMSDAELKLRDNMSAEMENLAGYHNELELIKQKHRYQEEQMRKAMLSSKHAANGSKNWDGQSFQQIQSIKEILANQSKQIAELLTLFNLIKKNHSEEHSSLINTVFGNRK